MEVKIDPIGRADLPDLPLVLALKVTCIVYKPKHKRSLGIMQFHNLRNTEGEPERSRFQNYHLFWQNDQKYKLL